MGRASVEVSRRPVTAKARIRSQYSIVRRWGPCGGRDRYCPGGPCGGRDRYCPGGPCGGRDRYCPGHRCLSWQYDISSASDTFTHLSPSVCSLSNINRRQYSLFYTDTVGHLVTQQCEDGDSPETKKQETYTIALYSGFVQLAFIVKSREQMPA